MNTTKLALIYHKADLDGVLSGVIAERFLRDTKNQISLFPKDYGDDFKSIDWSVFDKIYMLDLSDDWLLTSKYSNKIIWIDHHKSAIDKKYKVAQYCVNGVAACRLTYQFFTNKNWSFLYSDNLYYNRYVEEPFIVTLAGEYDIWDEESLVGRYVNKGITDISFENIEKLFIRTDFILTEKGSSKSKDRQLLTDNKNKDGFREIYLAMTRGEAVIDYMRETQNIVVPAKVSLFGKSGWAYNTHIRNSLVADQKDDFTMVWNRSGSDHLIKVSLYSETIDVSKLATQFGGGGHAGAAGFQVPLHIFERILTVGYP